MKMLLRCLTIGILMSSQAQGIFEREEGSNNEPQRNLEGSVSREAEDLEFFKNREEVKARILAGGADEISGRIRGFLQGIEERGVLLNFAQMCVEFAERGEIGDDLILLIFQVNLQGVLFQRNANYRNLLFRLARRSAWAPFIRQLEIPFLAVYPQHIQDGYWGEIQFVLREVRKISKLTFELGEEEPEELPDMGPLLEETLESKQVEELDLSAPWIQNAETFSKVLRIIGERGEHLRELELFVPYSIKTLWDEIEKKLIEGQLQWAEIAPAIRRYPSILVPYVFDEEPFQELESYAHKRNIRAIKREIRQLLDSIRWKESRLFTCLDASTTQDMVDLLIARLPRIDGFFPIPYEKDTPAEMVRALREATEGMDNIDVYLSEEDK